MSRPENVKHWNDLLDADDATYPNDDELMTISSRFSDAFRLFRFGVGHHVLKPGRRTSYPHAELAEEEFVYVLEGTPDLWQDGHLHRLQPGDGVGWPSGTGIAHCLINNTDSDVRLLVVGEPSRRRYGVHYPLHPSRNAELGEQWWHDAPKRELGPHDGMPEALREKLKKGP